jgi:glycosyltransferase involved in cell wall biosynthesis
LGIYELEGGVEKMYSVVVPVLNEQQVIEETHRRLVNVMKQTNENYEIIYVNDGSTDKTSKILRRLQKTDKNIKILEFSRNFGHQIAISAGVDHAKGDAVVIIDADLQDPPEVILKMIEKWKSGFDVVYGKRVKRKGESVFKKATAALYYRILRKLTDVDMPVDAGDFRLMDKKVCRHIKNMREKHRYMRGIVNWVGFSHTAVEYIREKRFAGVPKYNLRRMIRFANDGITSFSHKPLRFSLYLGAAFELASAIAAVAAALGYRPLWLVVLCIAAFTNGIVLIMLGIMGEYIGRIYEECKNRPLYILADKVGFETDEEN